MLESEAGWMLERRTTCPDCAHPESTNRDSAPDGPLPPLNPAGNPGSNHASRLPGESVLRIFVAQDSPPSESCHVAMTHGANMPGAGSPPSRRRVRRRHLGHAAAVVFGGPRTAHSSKNRPAAQGNTKLNPGPLKNEPIITSTAQNIRWIVISEMANLRSSGLFDGFLSI